MKRNFSVLSGFFFILLFLSSCGPSNNRASVQNSTNLTFEILFPSEVHPEAITGRMYVLISRSGDKEPRHSTAVSNAHPTGEGYMYGQNIFSVDPGELAILDGEAFGFPLESINDIPPGEYYVQGFVNIYTEFERSDGHTLWMHNDQWEGQKWHRSPGNLFSDVHKVFVDPSKQQAITLSCENVIPPIEVLPDTRWVKRIKFQSEILTEFWGRPIYLGATVLLPKGYDEHPDVYYPVNYAQGHFSLSAPHGFVTEDPGEQSSSRGRRGYEFYEYWTSDEAPRMIAVTFQHPSPYFDDSYAVNSPNVGPYGDAILEELIPLVEESFRIIRKPYARVLSGGSTGGWESFALQVFHPDFFGGTWSSCPDPVDFRYYELINIYEDNNAYYRDHNELSHVDYSEYNYLKSERPEAREIDGQIRYTVRDTYYYEWTIGDRHRSEAQWAIWEAAFGPIGEDGYPKPLWDWRTGEIDHEVAEQWRDKDLRDYLEKNWSWIGPKLVGKLHIYVGDMDNYYLNNAVVLMEEFLESTKDPYYAGVVEYGWRAPHCWGPRGVELLKLFEEHITKNAPEGDNPSRWKY